MQMLISGIVGHDDKKHACVCFQDGTKTAEGTVPDCIITQNSGFSCEEVTALEQYMQDNLTKIKAEAAKVNPIKAMMQSSSHQTNNIK